MPRLTPEIERLIVASIRKGALPRVAVASAGISRRCLARWVEEARRDRKSPYRPFLKKVLQARAQARVTAAIEVRAKDAKFWLTHVDGTAKREREGESLANFMSWLATLLPALDPYPAARQALAAALENGARETVNNSHRNAL